MIGAKAGAQVGVIAKRLVGRMAAATQGNPGYGTLRAVFLDDA